MKYIEMRIILKDDFEEDIEELAEQIKDTFYNEYDSELTLVKDVTYEIKETEGK